MGLLCWGLRPTGREFFVPARTLIAVKLLNSSVTSTSNVISGITVGSRLPGQHIPCAFYSPQPVDVVGPIDVLSEGAVLDIPVPGILPLSTGSNI